MANILDKLRESANQLLASEAEDFAMWQNLKHTKSDLETILQFSIAEISFFTKDGEPRSIVCTSNMPFIKMLSLKKNEQKVEMAGKAVTGIKTKHKDSVDTWDLVDNKRKTISLNNWGIVHLITISPKNIVVLNDLVTKLLKY